MLDLKDAVICSNRPEDEVIGRAFAELINTILSELGREAFTFDFADPKEERITLTISRSASGRQTRCSSSASTRTGIGRGACCAG